MRTQPGELLRSSIFLHVAALLLGVLTAALDASGLEWGETLAGWTLVTALTLWLYSAWLSWRARAHGDRSRWWKVIPFLALVELSAGVFALSIVLAYDAAYAEAADTLISSGAPCLLPFFTIIVAAKWVRRKAPRRRVPDRKERKFVPAVRTAVTLQFVALGSATAAYALSSCAENETALVLCVNLAVAALVTAVWSGVRAIRAIELGARTWAAWAVFLVTVLEVNAFVLGVYAAYCGRGPLPGALQIIVESCLPVLVPVLTVSGFLAWFVYACLQRIARRFGAKLGLRWIAGLYAGLFLIFAPIPVFAYCAIQRSSHIPVYDWVVECAPNCIRDRGMWALSFLPQCRPVVFDLMARQCCSANALMFAVSSQPAYAEDAFAALGEDYPREAYTFAHRVALGEQTSASDFLIKPYFATHATVADLRETFLRGSNFEFLDTLVFNLVREGRIEAGAEIRGYLERRSLHRKELLDQIARNIGWFNVRSNILVAYLLVDDESFFVARGNRIDYLGRFADAVERRNAIRDAFALGDRPLALQLLTYEMPLHRNNNTRARQIWCAWLLQCLDGDDLLMKQWVATRLCEAGGLDVESPFEWKAEDTAHIAGEVQKIRERSWAWMRTVEDEPEPTVYKFQSSPTDE